jgi:hypothetical protein
MDLPSLAAACRYDGSPSTVVTAVAIRAPWRPSRHRDPGPASDDPNGVVALVAAVVEDDQRHSRRERLDDGAVAAVGDDEIGLREHSAVRRGCHDGDVGRSTDLVGADGRPRGDESPHRKSAERIGDPLEALHVVLERRRHRDEHEWAFARGRVPCSVVGPDRVVEDRPHIAHAVGQLRREVEGRRGEHELAPRPTHLIPGVRDRVETVPGADRIHPLERIAVENSRDRGVGDLITKPPERTARR